MEFKVLTSWIPDNHPETTKAVVLISSCGTCAKRLSYIRWNIKNGSYNNMKEHVYKFANRGIKENCLLKNSYLCFEVNGKLLAVHRAVAMAWLPNPENKDEVNHINGDKSDNRHENLEWVTREENLSHALNTGLIRRGSNHQNSKLNEIQVSEIKLKLNESTYFGQLTDIAKEYGVSKHLILNIKKGRAWKHV